MIANRNLVLIRDRMNLNSAGVDESAILAVKIDHGRFGAIPENRRVLPADIWALDTQIIFGCPAN